MDVHTERAIQGGNEARLNNPETVDKATRSAERYADAFAALTMNAQQPLNGQQWNGIATWRMKSGAGHDNANFIRRVQDQVQRDPVAREAMRSDGGAGFSVQALASFLKPIWMTYEAREIELGRNLQQANQGSRPAERVGQLSAERVSQAANYGIRPTDQGGATRPREAGRAAADGQEITTGPCSLR